MEDAFANILFLVFLGGVLVLAVSLVFYYQFLRRRAFLETASDLGLQYYYRSYAIPRRFAFLSQQRRGRGRHAFNILRGSWHNANVFVFDYMFNTGIGREKTWHYCSFAVIHHDHACESLRIYPRTMLETLGHIVGFEEIFFDMPDFEQDFAVFTTHEPHARAVCTVPLIEYLRHHPELSVEVEDAWLALGSESCLLPEEISRRLRQAEKVRSLLGLYDLETIADKRTEPSDTRLRQ